MKNSLRKKLTSVASILTFSLLIFTSCMPSDSYSSDTNMVSEAETTITSVTTPISTTAATSETTTSIISEITSESDSVEYTESENTTEALDCNPINADDIELFCQSDYSHADTDSYMLGNNEGLSLLITVNYPVFEIDDLIVYYDENLIDVEIVKETPGTYSTDIEFYVTGKKPGNSEIIVTTYYELLTKKDEASVFTVNLTKLNSTDGQIVYVTPTGDKYHYSSDCAGYNSIKTTLRDAEAYEYEPCGNCAY